MKWALSFIICVLTALFLACQPAATEQDLNDMCKNLVTVRGEADIPDENEVLAEIEEDFKGKEKRLLDWKARDMKGWDDELAAKIKALEEGDKGKKSKKSKKDKNEDEEAEKPTKESLEADYAKKKETGAKQFDDDLAKLGPAKEDAIKEAKQKIENKKKKRDELVKQCIDEAKDQSVSKPLAQCRSKAPDKDTYWNKCK